MPVLQDSRQEAFAQLRARGALISDAYEDAGFVPDRAHASRLNQRKDVAERIAELRAEQAGIDGARTRSVIAALLKLAKANEGATDAALVKEARLTLLEARRLCEDLEGDRARRRRPNDPEFLEA